MNEGFLNVPNERQPTNGQGGREVFDQTSMRHFVPVPAWNKKWRAFSLGAPFTYLFLTHKTNRTLLVRQPFHLAEGCRFPLSSSIQYEYDVQGSSS